MRTNWPAMESSAAAERDEPNTGHAGTKKQSSTIAKKRLAGDIALERHYSVCELAQLWGLSEKTIRRMFVDEPGVMKWGHEEGRFKRGYMTLRIPESVVQRVHRRLRQVG